LLSIILNCHSVECYSDMCHFAECESALCRSDEWHSAKCHSWLATFL